MAYLYLINANSRIVGMVSDTDQCPDGMTIVESEDYVEPGQAMLDGDKVVPKPPRDFETVLEAPMTPPEPDTTLSELVARATTVAGLKKALALMALSIEGRYQEYREGLEAIDKPKASEPTGQALPNPVNHP
jgi:hypothetical protein